MRKGDQVYNTRARTHARTHARTQQCQRDCLLEIPGDVLDEAKLKPVATGCRSVCCSCVISFSTFCTRKDRMGSSECISQQPAHIVFILCSYCVHIVFILCSCCVHAGNEQGYACQNCCCRGSSLPHFSTRNCFSAFSSAMSCRTYRAMCSATPICCSASNHGCLCPDSRMALSVVDSSVVKRDMQGGRWRW